MDLFEILLYAAALIVYFLFQAAGSKKKPKRPSSDPSQPSPGEPGGPRSLEDALREIEQALGGGPVAQEEPRPVPEPMASEPPERPLSSADTGRKTALERAIERRPDLKPPGETFSAEERFERAKRFHEPGFETPWTHTAHGPLGSPQMPSRGRRLPERARALRLNDPAAARRAILLREVLGPPRALRPFGDSEA